MKICLFCWPCHLINVESICVNNGSVLSGDMPSSLDNWWPRPLTYIRIRHQWLKLDIYSYLCSLPVVMLKPFDVDCWYNKTSTIVSKGKAKTAALCNKIYNKTLKMPIGGSIVWRWVLYVLNWKSTTVQSHGILVILNVLTVTSNQTFWSSIW